MTKPYVGITGATTIDEIDFISEEFRDAGFYSADSTHNPMIGFLASNKTLNHEELENPLHAMTHPRIENLWGLLQHAKKKELFTTVHYHTASQKNLSKEIGKLMKKYYYNELCDTVQLNTVWPDVKELAKLQREFHVNIIFQANEKSMKDLSPGEYAERLKTYKEYIQHVLLDLSSGKGIELDVHKLIPYYQQIRQKLPEVKIGWSGGLGGENTGEKIKEIFTATGTRNFSTDIEKMVRTGDNSKQDRYKVRSALQPQGAFFNSS